MEPIPPPMLPGQSAPVADTFLTAVPLPYASQPAEQHALYTPRAVGLATFLGGPLAGTVVMAMNYRRVGRPASAVKAILGGLAGTAALGALAFVLPEHSPGFLLGLIPLFVMVKLASTLQGETVNRHKYAGGKIASMWKAAGVGLLSLILLVAVVFAAVFSWEWLRAGSSVVVGNAQIRYSGSATKADAEGLGKALGDVGFLNGQHAVTVFFVKDASGKTVKFVVNETAGRQAGTLELFVAIVEKIAPSIGGKPITLKLLSPQQTELQSKKVE